MTEKRIPGIRERLEIILVNKKEKKKNNENNRKGKNQCPWSRECNKWGKKSDIQEKMYKK